MLNDLGVVGVPEEDWEGKCQLKCVWRKMLWELSHPGQKSRPLRASGRRGQQPAVQYAERYSPYLSQSQQQMQQQKESTCFGGSQQQLPPGFC